MAVDGVRPPKADVAGGPAGGGRDNGVEGVSGEVLVSVDEVCEFGEGGERAGGNLRPEGGGAADGRVEVRGVSFVEALEGDVFADEGLGTG